MTTLAQVTASINLTSEDDKGRMQLTVDPTGIGDCALVANSPKTPSLAEWARGRVAIPLVAWALRIGVLRVASHSDGGGCRICAGSICGLEHIALLRSAAVSALAHQHDKFGSQHQGRFAKGGKYAVDKYLSQCKFLGIQAVPISPSEYSSA